MCNLFSLKRHMLSSSSHTAEGVGAMSSWVLAPVTRLPRRPLALLSRSLLPCPHTHFASQHRLLCRHGFGVSRCAAWRGIRAPQFYLRLLCLLLHVRGCVQGPKRNSQGLLGRDQPQGSLSHPPLSCQLLSRVLWQSSGGRWYVHNTK